MVEHKDVMQALLGASASLSGFVLVFLGIVVTAYQSFDAPTSRKVLRPYQISATIALAAFGLGLVCVATAAGWLIDKHDNEWLYKSSIATFVGQLVALAVSTGRVIKRALWS